MLKSNQDKNNCFRCRQNHNLQIYKIRAQHLKLLIHRQNALISKENGAGWHKTMKSTVLSADRAIWNHTSQYTCLREQILNPYQVFILWCWDGSKSYFAHISIFKSWIRWVCSVRPAPIHVHGKSSLVAESIQSYLILQNKNVIFPEDNIPQVHAMIKLK